MYNAYPCPKAPCRPGKPSQLVIRAPQEKKELFRTIAPCIACISVNHIHDIRERRRRGVWGRRRKSRERVGEQDPKSSFVEEDEGEGGHSIYGGVGSRLLKLTGEVMF